MRMLPLVFINDHIDVLVVGDLQGRSIVVHLFLFGVMNGLSELLFMSLHGILDVRGGYD